MINSLVLSGKIFCGIIAVMTFGLCIYLGINVCREERYHFKREQVKQLESRLHDIEFLYVFSSPLKRALQTVVTVAPYIKPVMDERMIGMGY